MVINASLRVCVCVCECGFRCKVSGRANCRIIKTAVFICVVFSRVKRTQRARSDVI